MAEGLNLTRMGHYFVPQGEGAGPDGLPATFGSCQTAVVVGVNSHEDVTTVNLRGWTHEGEEFRHLEVATDADPRSASFHLSRDCPFGR